MKENESIRVNDENKEREVGVDREGRKIVERGTRREG